MKSQKEDRYWNCAPKRKPGSGKEVALATTSSGNATGITIACVW